MSNQSMVKMGIVYAMAFMAGWTWWDRRSEAADAKQQCMAQASMVTSVNAEPVCDCMVAYTLRQVGILHHVPIITSFLPQPNFSRITEDAQRFCMGG